MAGERDANAQGRMGQLRSYANDLALGVRLSEVELRFGQRFGEGVTVHSWIVTSPVHLLTFRRLIVAAIADYEARYGAIPDLPEG